MPKLYALLVAVGQYADPRHNLKGCAADIETMDRLLERQAELNGLEYSKKRLKDHEATRQNVIDGFDHFSSAGAEDHCVFYYSGHGSFAPVPFSFFNDSSGRNESLVCHDSRTPGGRDLMDKELAYLAHRAMNAGKPKFTSILDCCHSGNNFRSLHETGEEEIRDRQTSAAGSVPIEQYLGFDDYLEKDGKKLPPHYPALHLAACRPDERAQERPIDGVSQGVFTYCLSRELSQSGPGVSVEELMRRVNIRANTVNPKQFPYLDNEGTDRHRRSLFSTGNEDVQAAAGFGGPVYRIHFRDGDWYLDAGSVQNIQVGSDEHPTILEESDGGQWRVNRVEAHRSVVARVDGSTPNRNEIFAANLKTNGLEKLNVLLHPNLPQDWQQVFLDLAAEYPELKLITDECEGAGYRVDKYQSSVILVRPEQGTPLFKRVSLYDDEERPDQVREFLNQVAQVATWEGLRSLSNPRTQIPERAISVEVTVKEYGSSTREIRDFGEPVSIHYRRDEAGQEVEPTYQVKIRNEANRTFFLSVLYSSSDFAISNELAPWQELSPGADFYLSVRDDFGDAITEFSPSFDDSYHGWGVTEITDHLKILISANDEIDTSVFNREGLELDNRENLRGERQDRGFKPARKRIDDRDWTVKNISFKIVRPLDAVNIGGYEQELGGMTIEGVSGGFSAKAKLSSLETGSRSVQRALPNIFSGGELLNLNAITGERDLSDGLNALELTDIKNPDAVSATSPLKITTGQHFAENESIIPFGYDPESGAYYPLGYLNEAGELLIQDIPSEVVDERSFGGSVKIFFQKVVGKWLGVKSEYPLLRRVVEETPGGTLVYASEDLDGIATSIATLKPKKVALFVHGIIGDTESSTAILQHVAKQTGEQFDDRFQVVLTFDYENLGTNIDQTGRDLLEKLTKLGFGQSAAPELHLFAHSMGGLVSRWMIEKEEGNKLVDRLLTFGTPHGGSPWSNVFGLLTSAITYGISGASLAQPWMLALLGFERLWKKSQTTLVEMGPDGAFIKRLNDNSTAPIPYVLVAGNTQLVKTEAEEKLRGFIERLIYRFRHHPHYALLDAGMFREPNDIAVSLKSQQLVKGDLVTKPEPIACDHLSYFNNPFCIELVEELTRD
ncbi:hypothetical protein CEQ90_08455 [Lewinellaceae bacterium SD302]|nr:hypothetical protein CEQ90_08455 [Lewinellaceae bacterium SD302]